MGANFQTMTVPGDLSHEQLKQRFVAAQDDDRFENGHSYSGGFGMASGLTIIDDGDFDTEEFAEEYLNENCRKWEDALAVKFTTPDGGTKWMIGAVCAS